MVGINEHIISTDKKITLETKAIATCIAVGGHTKKNGGVFFLTHLLYSDANLEKSIKNAEKILNTIQIELKSKNVDFSDFNLYLAGAGFGAYDFEKELLWILVHKYGANLNASNVKLGGTSTFSMEITSTSTIIKQSAPGRQFIN